MINAPTTTITLCSRTLSIVTGQTMLDLSVVPAVIRNIALYIPLRLYPSFLLVCKTWKDVIDLSDDLWLSLLKRESLFVGRNSEEAFASAIHQRAVQYGGSTTSSAFKALFKSRYLTRLRWETNTNPSHLTFPAHGRSVVTCLMLYHGQIISASDDHSIHIYSLSDGSLVHSLIGHEGGVWALAATKDTLVSGSTDRTVRIWDMSTGRCTHIFGGHTSTVRCLAIFKPEMVDVEDERGVIQQERWPKRPLIVTGSRDHTLRVWTLPRPDEQEYKFCGSEDADADPADVSWSACCIAGAF
jgi:F-box and WD-40 domain protein CDC4